MDNYYDILEVERGSSIDEVKKAYRKMAKKYHPDKNPGDEEANVKFKKIGEAYSILKDPNKKENYDRFGDINGSPFSQNPFSEFNDFFSGFGGFSRNNKPKGNDLKVEIKVSIDDIINGTEKTIKYNRKEACDKCDGKGGKNPKKCGVCKGSGSIDQTINSPFGAIKNTIPCNECGSSGVVYKDECSACKGSGTTIKSNKVTLEIPIGVNDGMVFSMPGFGNYIKNGRNGDLIIEIKEEKEAHFERVRGDIIINKDISITDAILGKELTIKTHIDERKIQIKKGTQVNDEIVINGGGVPFIYGNYGNLIIKLNIKIPKEITEEERDILEKLSNSDSFK